MPNSPNDSPQPESSLANEDGRSEVERRTPPTTIPPSKRPYPIYQNSPRKLFVLIVVGLVVWAAVHALGTWLGGAEKVALQNNILRGCVVVACMAIFLGFWWLMLRSQKPRRTKFRLPAEPRDRPAAPGDDRPTGS